MVKKLLTISYVLYIPFIFVISQLISYHDALQTHGSDLTQDQALQNSQNVSNDQPIDALEKLDPVLFEVDDDSLGQDNIQNEKSTKRADLGNKDHTPGDSSQNTIASMEDQEKAAEMGIAPETYKSLSDLLKETAGIDIGNKPVEKLSEDISEGQVDDMIKRRALDDKICPDSPEGVDKRCIPCYSDASSTYTHIDQNGFQCQCDICKKPTYMKTPCTCSRNGDVEIGPTCDFPEPGKTYMSHRNWCPIPFTCRTTCPGDMVIVKNCTVAADAECGCPEETDPTGETSCKPIPYCNEGFETQRTVDNTRYSVHICQPCKEGYIQPKNNTRQKCFLPPPPSTDDKYSPDDEGDLIPSTNGLRSGASESTLNPSETDLPDINDCICPSTPTPSTEKSGTTVRLLHPSFKIFISVCAVIISYVLGICMSSLVKSKLRQWCDSCFSGRSHQAAANTHYDNNNTDDAHVVDMVQSRQQSEAIFDKRTGQIGTKLSKRGGRR